MAVIVWEDGRRKKRNSGEERDQMYGRLRQTS